jgi:hypothetical protein
MANDSNTVCAFWGVHFGTKTTDFCWKSVKLLPVNASFLNHQKLQYAPKGNFKVMIFWKLMTNATKWAMFALWPMGRYRYILGQNHKILLKNRQILEKMCNHFIFTSILNLCEYFYNKCHRLSFLMFQTQFVCSIRHLEAKTADFL